MIKEETKMTNLNENSKAFDTNEEVLAQVNGGLKPEDVKIPPEFAEPDDKSGGGLPRGKVIT